MPPVTLRYDEAEGNLPDVCMRCGAPAVCRVERVFRLHDMQTYGRGGILALIRLINDLVQRFSSATLTLRAPFCVHHRRHWTIHQTLAWAILALLPLLLVGDLGLVVTGIMRGRPAAAFLVLACTGVIVAATLAWGLAIQKIGISEKNETITLSHVHSRFIAAVEQQRATSPPPAVRGNPKRTEDAAPAASAAPLAIRIGPSPHARPNPPPRQPQDRTEDAEDDTPRRPRSRPSEPNSLALILTLAIGVPLVLLVILAVVVGIGSRIAALVRDRQNAPAAAVGEQNPGAQPQAPPAEPDRDVEPGTAVPKAPPPPPVPAELAAQPSINLIPLINPRKDIVHGRWLVVGKELHCNDGSFVPRMQFPYIPPEEYDIVVTFSQPGLRNGISLVMPNPNGGSFFWFLGNDNGTGYGFHSNPDKGGHIPGLIKSDTVYTTVVQVRKGSVRALLDGKELMNLKTDYRDLTCDDWRRIHNTRFLAVACDDPTVFHFVRVIEVTGHGKKGR